MIPNKKYFALPGLALLAMIFIACNDDEPTEVYVGDMAQYQKAYITTGVSYPNGTMLNGGYTADALQLNDAGKLVFVEGGKLAPSGDGSFDTDIYFRTTYAVRKAISGTIALIPDAEEFVARYNSEHQTECKLLPAEYYTIGNSHATIEAGSKSAVIHVVANTDNEWNIGEYLLPLKMTMDDGADISLVENMSTICLKYSIAAKPESPYPVGCRILSRDEFDIEVIENAPVGYENAFDSDRSTGWNENGYSSVCVTFKEPHYVSRICVVDCDYYYYTWLSYEDTPDDLFGGRYTRGVASGLSEFNPVSTLGYDASRKVKCVALRNYYAWIADIYFIVYD